MVKSLEVYNYLESIRNYSHSDNIDYIEDICDIIIDYHKCGCRDRLYGIDELLNATDDNDNVYGDIFEKHGVIGGLKLSVSYAKLLSKRNSDKSNFFTFEPDYSKMDFIETTEYLTKKEILARFPLTADEAFNLN